MTTSTKATHSNKILPLVGRWSMLEKEHTQPSRSIFKLNKNRQPKYMCPFFRQLGSLLLSFWHRICTAKLHV